MGIIYTWKEKKILSLDMRNAAGIHESSPIHLEKSFSQLLTPSLFGIEVDGIILLRLPEEPTIQRASRKTCIQRSKPPGNEQVFIHY